MGEIFSNDTFSKRLMSNADKELIKLNIKK